MAVVQRNLFDTIAAESVHVRSWYLTLSHFLILIFRSRQHYGHRS